MRIFTVYQKLVLRLLCAILWRILYKNALDAGLFKDLEQKHSDLINKAQDEIAKC